MPWPLAIVSATGMRALGRPAAPSPISMPRCWDERSAAYIFSAQRRATSSASVTPTSGPRIDDQGNTQAKQGYPNIIYLKSWYRLTCAPADGGQIDVRSQHRA